MKNDDKNNLYLASSQSDVDIINNKFYSRFNYPWHPAEFPFIHERDFWRKLLCQDIGDFQFDRIPERPKIWVAGCGTNQAIFTALKFPNAEIIGTDISVKSIEVCRQNAAQLLIKNLKLEVGSLNEIKYENEFDYVICTGVIHHNADPLLPLRTLAKALKADGILELMVYNYYHRVLTTAYQKAIRLISGTVSSLQSGIDIMLNKEFELTKELIRNFPVDNVMKGFVASFQDKEEADLADNLLQPVEHSYTIESLNELVDSVDLELMSHCVNQFDVAEKRLTWNMELSDPHYENLKDVDRWQVGNLLMLERSPMLWFYVQRKKAHKKRLSEEEMCRHFLQTIFAKAKTSKGRYILLPNGNYQENLEVQGFPSPYWITDSLARRVYNCIDSEATINQILENLNVQNKFRIVNNLRINLATTAFPYLIAFKSL